MILSTGSCGSGAFPEGFFIHIGPVEAAGVVFGIAEVIDFVTGLPERGDDFGLVWVPPTGGDVDSGHGLWFGAHKVTNNP